jgi:hypothetical protein
MSPLTYYPSWKVLASRSTCIVAGDREYSRQDTHDNEEEGHDDTCNDVLHSRFPEHSIGTVQNPERDARHWLQ